MARQTAALDGFDELEKKLARLSNRASGKTVKEAAKAGANVLRDEAATRAPKRSGNLASNIDIEPHRLQVGRAQFNIGFKQTAWYGRLVELGTQFMAAQPFLRPAFDAKKDEATRAVGDFLRRELGL